MPHVFDTENNDNGSLYTGNLRPAVGDEIHLQGESNPRTVTYVMGSEAKGWRACFKGQGVVPEGRVRWTWRAGSPDGPSCTEASSPVARPVSPTRPRPAAPLQATTSWPPPLTLSTTRRPAFDAYVLVDWSASAKRKRGPDSIWWVASRWRDGRLCFDKAENPDTRALAKHQLTKLLRELMEQGLSVLVGFDFPYGYAAGFATRLGTSANEQPWRSTWTRISRQIADNQGDLGENNRFEVAALFNRTIGGQGPFWGLPNNVHVPGLTSTKPALPWAVPEFRIAERRTRGPKSAFQLNGAGSVGGQALMGLPVLEALRDDPVLGPVSTVWPFETGATLPSRAAGPRIVHAEIYPSLVQHPVLEGWVKDEAQVVALTHHFASLDAAGELEHMFAAPGRLPEDERRKVLEEEGWILGVV